MSDVLFTKEDLRNIEKAYKEGGNIWKNPLVLDVKRKIKEHFRKVENEQCAYCKKNFKGEFRLDIDIEHILPKKHFPNLMFTLTNLTIACKRCNMKIKGQRLDFVTDLNKVKEDHSKSEYYKFSHPNFDNYFEHLNRIDIELNDVKLIKYKIVANSKKGKYTYDFFKLNELEIEAINTSQGLKPTSELSSKIDDETRELLIQLIEKS